MDNDKRILKTQKKSDGKRFNFLKSVGNELDKMLQKVNMIMYDVAESKPYTFDREKIVAEYEKLGVGDIDEFACNMTMNKYFEMMVQGVKIDEPTKQAYYEEVREFLWAKKAKGEIS